MGGEALFESLSVEVTNLGVSKVNFLSPPQTPRDSAPSTLEREALDQISQYLRGSRRSFDLPLDLRSVTPFRRTVLEELRRVPFGETVTYGELAHRVGCKSPRAVGQAMGRNPLPILIPCHRVVAGGRRLGGFTGGLARKVALLGLEGVEILR